MIREIELTVACARCLVEVVFQDVSDGYFAVCPNHDEDVYDFETVVMPKDELPVRKCELHPEAQVYYDPVMQEVTCPDCED